jgi:hypothetical protein
MPLEDRVQTLFAGLIATEREARDAELGKLLRSEQHKAAARKILGAGFYFTGQEDRCVDELRLRGAKLLAITKRVLDDSAVSCTEAVASDLLQLLAAEVETDHAHVVTALRQVTTSDFGFATGQQLWSAKASVLVSLKHEIDLLALKHDRTRVPLVDLLTSARYADCRTLWLKAAECLSKSPPDLEGAVISAVGAVESVAKLIVGNPSATLGVAIKVLRSQGKIEAPLLKGFEELWGYANTARNTRHGGGAGTPVSPDVARYVFDSSAACLRLLLSRDVI